MTGVTNRVNDKYKGYHGNTLKAQIHRLYVLTSHEPQLSKCSDFLHILSLFYQKKWAVELAQLFMQTQVCPALIFHVEIHW